MNLDPQTNAEHQAARKNRTQEQRYHCSSTPGSWSRSWSVGLPSATQAGRVR